MSGTQLTALDLMIRARSSSAPAAASIDDRRRSFTDLMSSQPLHPDVRTAAADLGGRPSLTVTPARRADGVLLYLHGGGYVLGSPSSGAPLASHLAARTGYVAHVPGYRLAPENPFPAAVEDGLSAYRELLGSHPAEQIVLAGDSAGGGLVLAIELAARDEGLPQPAAGAVFSPWTDLTLSGRSAVAREQADPIFDRADLAELVALYAPHGDESAPLSSPLFADLTGLAPLLIQVGGNEVLLDDAVRLASRAASMDVEVHLEVLPGAPHVYQSHTGLLDEADQALARAAAFMLGHATPTES